MGEIKLMSGNSCLEEKEMTEVYTLPSLKLKFKQNVFNIVHLCNVGVELFIDWQYFKAFR